MLSPEALLQLIKSRRSIRAFKPDPIPDEHVKLIIEAARWAPSAGNLQPWHFVVVRDPERKRALAEAALHQMFIAEAPVVIVVGADRERSALRYGDRGRYLYCLLDCGAAIQNMLLMIHALGYGACWVGAFYDDEVRRIVGFPEHVQPVAIIPVGKPAESPHPPPRRPLSDVMYEEQFRR